MHTTCRELDPEDALEISTALMRCFVAGTDLHQKLLDKTYDCSCTFMPYSVTSEPSLAGNPHRLLPMLCCLSLPSVSGIFQELHLGVCCCRTRLASGSLDTWRERDLREASH